MRRTVPTVPKNTPREALAELLRTNNALLVKGTESGETVGIITPADLL